jgi:polysaccharide export outer membrane protein
MFRHTLRLLLTTALLAVSLGSAARADQPAAPKVDKSSFIYRLTITDRIRVSIFQEDDLAEIARIDARGNINLKLVGEIHVAGLTINEAQHAIEQAYIDGRYLRNPQATVSVEEYAPREVSIQGQVKAPGRYLLPIESTYSIVELVTKAGGLTDIAKGSNVIVTRVLPDGTKKTFTVDVESIIRGKDSSAQAHSLLLEPGDIVYVPERII